MANQPVSGMIIAAGIAILMLAAVILLSVRRGRQRRRHAPQQRIDLFHRKD
jgi:hypothetical protein